MTELERYKAALDAAVYPLNNLLAGATLDHATAAIALKRVENFLNPPPVTEEVEVETWWVFNDGVKCFQANSKEECIMWARNVGQPEGIQYVKLTGTYTRPVPQKTERSAVAEDVLFDRGGDGTVIWPYNAKLTGDADWISIVGKKVKMVLTWEE